MRQRRWVEKVDHLLLKQSPGKWHAFGKTGWTASGTTQETATKGGLGDVIDTDAQLRSYCRIVMRAPTRLVDAYAGLYEAQKQCGEMRR